MAVQSSIRGMCRAVPWGTQHSVGVLCSAHTGLQCSAPVGVPAGQPCGGVSWALQCCAAPSYPKEEVPGVVGCSTNEGTAGKKGDVWRSSLTTVFC